MAESPRHARHPVVRLLTVLVGVAVVGVVFYHDPIWYLPVSVTVGIAALALAVTFAWTARKRRRRADGYR